MVFLPTNNLRETINTIALVSHGQQVAETVVGVGSTVKPVLKYQKGLTNKSQNLLVVVIISLHKCRWR